MQRTWTVIVDSRERKPLPLPETISVLDDAKPAHWKSLVTVRLIRQVRTLDAGDYALAGFENKVLIERKCGAQELVGNCLTRDRDRFIRALDRLAAATVLPYLMVEGSVHNLLKEEDGPAALDSLTRLTAERGIRLSFAPCETAAARIGMASWVVRTLISGALFPCTPPGPRTTTDRGGPTTGTGPRSPKSSLVPSSPTRSPPGRSSCPEVPSPTEHAPTVDIGLQIAATP